MDCGCYPSFSGFIRQLSTMPYCHNPYTIILNLIEETIRIYDNFTKREFRKLRYGSPRLRKFLESRERDFSAF
jgi:hypothetical protein